MSEINTGGPAFPLQSIGPEFHHGYSGMTLRDYFAAKAMQGCLGDPDLVMSRDEIASWAYQVADAMLEARQA